MSATIGDQLLKDLNRFGQDERRLRSQIIEMTLEEYLHKCRGTEDEIVTSEGRFEGGFNRAGTYER